MRYRRIPHLGDDYLQTKQRIHIIERIVQAIGFNPDYPYTLTVSDGAKNTVEIGKIGSEYGIKIVNSAGNTIVFADGHITADGITTGTLDASVVNVTNINATNINTGTLNASVVNVENIDADEITTGTLDADRIASRSLDADKIKSHDITADELSTGELITQSAQIGSAVITSAHIDSIDAGKISTGTLDAITINLNGVDLSGYLGIGGTGQPSRILAQQSEEDQTGFYTFSGGSKIWEDSNEYMGFKSIGERFYFYTGGTLYALLQRGAQASFFAGVRSEGSFNVVDSDARINNGKLRVNRSDSPSEDFSVGGDSLLEGNVSSNHHDPRAGGSYNLGGSSDYWWYLNVYEITKQAGGGFGVFDEGVEMQDGKVLPDTEALLAMKPHKNKKTDYGKPQYDMNTIPKAVRHIPEEDNKGNPIFKNEKGKYISIQKKDIWDEEKEDYITKEVEVEHNEGERVFTMMSIMLGAIRELTQRTKSLESQVNNLQKGK